MVLDQIGSLFSNGVNGHYQTFYHMYFLFILIMCLSRSIFLSFYRPAQHETDALSSASARNTGSVLLIPYRNPETQLWNNQLNCDCFLVLKK